MDTEEPLKLARTTLSAYANIIQLTLAPLSKLVIHLILSKFPVGLG
jgi:hypothetical protein